MDRLYNYILTILWTSEEEETKQLLTEQKPTKKRTINVFIFVFFIVTITFYATINLLMMSAVILLFVYWILQVQVLSVRRLKMNKETRAPLYFNQVQQLLQRRKAEDALNVYLQYTMRDEDLDNIKLYLITLFHNRKWDDIIQTMQRHNVENKDIQTMYKFSLLQSNQFDILQPLLENTDLDYIMLQLSQGDKLDIDKIEDLELRHLAERI
jgi:hypothetical protein